MERKRPQTKKSAYFAARRAYREKRAAPRNTLTEEQWQQMILWFGNKCLSCRRPFSSLIPATKDHVIPLARGGALTVENTQPLCRRCNSIKKARIIDLRDPARLDAFLKMYSWGKYAEPENTIDQTTP